MSSQNCPFCQCNTSTLPDFDCGIHVWGQGGTLRPSTVPNIDSGSTLVCFVRRKCLTGCRGHNERSRPGARHVYPFLNVIPADSCFRFLVCCVHLGNGIGNNKLSSATPTGTQHELPTPPPPPPQQSTIHKAGFVLRSLAAVLVKRSDD